MAAALPISFKIVYGEDIRRFQLLDGVSFATLARKVATLFPLNNLRITWRDADGDFVTVATDEDLQTAVAAAQVSSEGVVRLTVWDTGSATFGAPAATLASSVPVLSRSTSSLGGSLGAVAATNNTAPAPPTTTTTASATSAAVPVRGVAAISLEADAETLADASVEEEEEKEEAVPMVDESSDAPVRHAAAAAAAASAPAPAPAAASRDDVAAAAAAREEEERREPLLPGQHPHVICDGCQGAVVGFRFKCVACPDFDLCGGCAAQGLHAEHTMLRIARPDQYAYGLPLPLGWIMGALRHHGSQQQQQQHPGFGGGHGSCPRRGGPWAGCGAGGAARFGQAPAAAGAEGAAAGGASCPRGACGRGRWGPASGACGGAGVARDIPVHGGPQGAAAASGGSVPSAGAAGAATGGAAAGGRWEAELQLLRDMGIDVDAEILRTLLETHCGTVAAVITQLFANQ